MQRSDLVQSRQCMVDWLASQAVAPDGRVWSWVNPAHPGYAYAEAAGYVLSFLVAERQSAELRRLIYDQLIADFAEHGAVGRDGLLYLFDTAMVLHGLLAQTAEEGGATERDIAHIRRGLDFIAAQVDARSPVSRALTDRDEGTQWSLAFGPHQLKVARALIQAQRILAPAEHAPRIASLTSVLLPLQDHGRFRVTTNAAACQTHAHCYALEGLLSVIDAGILPEAIGRPALRAGVDWLARVQLRSGAIPEWHDGSAGWGTLRADVAAQAVRLWAIADPTEYERSIRRGLRFLSSLAAPGGAVRFAKGSADLNTWSTVFAAQAVELALGGSPRWVV